MSTSTRVSYGVLAFTIALAGFLHLGAPLLAAFFSYFALRKLLLLTKRKWLALILFGCGGGWSRLCRRLLYPGGTPRAAGSGRAFDPICQRVGAGAAD